jgi:hypothetical protein
MKLPNKIQNSKFKIQNYRLRSKAFYFLTTLFTFAFLLLSLNKVLAQEALRTYTITPPSIAQRLDPGQSADGILKVINDTDTALTFTTAIKDFIVEDTIGTPKMLPDNTLSNKYSAASWISVTPSTFTVQPHQRQQLNYYLHVPLNARPGGHYAAVTYKPNAPAGLTGTGATVYTESGSLFYITVNGPVTEKSIITKFFTNPFQEYGPVTIKTQIRNLGDLHITPKASITVTGLFYNKAQSLPVHNIFPEAARDFENSFGQTLMIGRYKAVLMGIYGINGNLPLVATVYFWVFPWRIALVITLAIIAVILAALYLRKKKKSSKQPKEPVEPKIEAPQPTEV